MAIIEKIKELKDKHGEKLVILAHHYQRSEIVDLADYKGDSFELSRKASENKDSSYTVFCGVHFMAESAAILAQPGQTVQIPDMDAGCWMADMADTILVERAWNEITEITGETSLLPIVYMNADAAVKAFCGKNGGIVCTSSNAPKAVKWAFEQREKILFIPDQHLGRNTGNSMGVPSDEMIVWTPGKPLGGNTPDQIKQASMILWDGHCLVHTRFKTDHMTAARNTYPDASIIVHPECTEEVVAMSDATGSTSGIVKYVEAASPGDTIIIGTEVNLVKRLMADHPDKKVLPLMESLCPNMHKINLNNLLETLENVGIVNIVTVPEHIKADAELALDRMLAL